MSHALERVKISRLGRSLPAAVLFALVMPATALAQDVRPDAGTHTVKRGDTLWDIAHAYLGDAYLWPEIYRLNTDQIEDPHWIYPGEVLKLPGRAGAVAEPGPGPAPEAEAPRRANSPTVFSTRTMTRNRVGQQVAALPTRVPVGDVVRAPYFDRMHGPATTGRILFSADLPGIDRPRGTSNFAMYDRLLMVPPAGSLAAERDRFTAYTLGEDVEDVGTIVIPSATLEVVRAPRDNEPAVVQVVALFGQLNAEDKVVPLDTAGTGSTAAPSPVPPTSVRTTTIRSINRSAVLPSLNYFVLFDLARKDGLKVGDEVVFYREREPAKGDDGPTLPEVELATGQVVRVTQYGATARVTTQAQPLLKVGEHVRVTARMP